jgi:hypothetical protein
LRDAHGTPAPDGHDLRAVDDDHAVANRSVGRTGIDRRTDDGQRRTSRARLADGPRPEEDRKYDYTQNEQGASHVELLADGVERALQN